MESCGTKGCRQPKYTPSGSKNFMCKYWKLQHQSKQDVIKQELQHNQFLKEKAFKEQFDLDKLIRIRETFRKVDKTFDAKKYVLDRHEENNVKPTPPVLGNVETFKQIDEDLKPLEEAERQISKLASSTEHGFLDHNDPKFKDDIEDKLRIFQETVSYLKQPEQPKNQHPIVKARALSLEQQITQQQQTIAKLRDSVNYLISVVTENNLKPLTPDDLKDFDQSNDVINQPQWDHFVTWSRYIKRSSKHKKMALLVCKDYRYVRYLLDTYPNIFSVWPIDWTSTTTKINIDPNKISLDRILILPDFSYIPEQLAKTRLAYVGTDYVTKQPYHSHATLFDQDEYMVELDIMKYFSSPSVKYSYESLHLHLPTYEKYTEHYSAFFNLNDHLLANEEGFD